LRDAVTPSISYAADGTARQLAQRLTASKCTELDRDTRIRFSRIDIIGEILLHEITTL
jgi:hypothetical protein